MSEDYCKLRIKATLLFEKVVRYSSYNADVTRGENDFEFQIKIREDMGELCRLLDLIKRYKRLVDTEIISKGESAYREWCKKNQ